MLLDWVVPPECPAEHEVVAHVTSLAGETVTAQPVRVWGRIVRVEERGPRRWRLELRIGNASETPRTLESQECRKLAEATAFIVALDLQSRAEAARTAPPPPDEAPAPVSETRRRPALPPKAPPSKPPAARTAPKVAPHGGLGTDLVGDVGSLPSVAWAGEIFGFVEYGSVRGELSGSLWPRNRATVDSPPDAGASILLRTVSARACFQPAPIRWADVCLRAEGGWIRTAGFGIVRPATSEGSWFAGLAGITVRPYEAGPVRLRATFEVGAPLHQPKVTIEGIGQLYEPQPIVFRLALGLETKLF